MIPVGYMYKSVSLRPDCIKTDSVKDVYSVSGCISEDFDDWLNEWKHNGYWLFDAPKIMESIAIEKGIDISNMRLFFYKASEKQWNEYEQKWENYSPAKAIRTDVQLPKKTNLEGYDIAAIYENSGSRCSPLSCNSLAEFLKVNSHCLLESYEDALKLIESRELDGCEEGPYKIFEVHSVILA